MTAPLVTEEHVLDVLREVVDPELGVNIVDLGLVYRVEINGGHVHVRMTLTAPGCPLHESLTGAVQSALELLLPGVKEVSVAVVWDPPWTPERISAAGRQLLGWR